MQSIAPGNHLPGNQLPGNPLPSNKARATAATQVASEITLSYDANGNLIDDGDQFTYEYDANDKLKIVRNRTTTAVVAEYRYDVFGRRVEKEVGSDITRYYHSGEQIIEERNGSDAVVATYTYGDYIDEPLTMDRDSERYYYHTNRMFSVYALTDSTGDLIERYSYTPYGVTTTYDDAYANSQPTSRVDNPFTFTGRELDAETLLMYYRARTYDPVEGRFKQLDPIGFEGGDLNLFRYVRNAPTDGVDPLGLFFCLPAIVAANTTPPITAKFNPVFTGRRRDLRPSSYESIYWIPLNVAAILTADTELHGFRNETDARGKKKFVNIFERATAFAGASWYCRCLRDGSCEAVLAGVAIGAVSKKGVGGKRPEFERDQGGIHQIINKPNVRFERSVEAETEDGGFSVSASIDFKIEASGDRITIEATVTSEGESPIAVAEPLGRRVNLEVRCLKMW